MLRWSWKSILVWWVRFGCVCFFLFTICALELMQIVVADEQYLIPPTPFVPGTAPSSRLSTAVACPSISSYPIRGSFASSACDHVACVQFSYNATTSASQTSSPTPERVMVQVQASDEASPSAAERWSPLRRTLYHLCRLVQRQNAKWTISGRLSESRKLCR